MKKSTRILFQTQEEKDFVKLVIEQNILCSGNELVELYQKVNECEFYNNLENQLTPIVTDKQEYFDYVKEYHSESLDDLKTAMREWYENGFLITQGISLGPMKWNFFRESLYSMPTTRLFFKRLIL